MDDNGLLKGSKILIVDDTRDNIYALSAFLESYDAEISSAAGGSEALKKIKEIPLDVVLLDIRMPEMDGFEVLRRMHLDLEMAKIPVIAVTAQAMPGDAEKCLKQGADDYVSKPIDTDILIGKLVKILSSRSTP